MKEEIVGLEIGSSGVVPGAAGMRLSGSIGLSRGRQSLDYSSDDGCPMPFLATREEGQFALIAAVSRRDNPPPPHIHHWEDERGE